MIYEDSRMAELNNQSTVNVAVVIPALNEELAIRSVVSAALAHCANVIVIDDGSSDGTAAQLVDLPITLITHAQPQGKAQAMLEGFSAALTHGYDGVVTMDGDGQHGAEDIPRLLAVAAQYPQHVVIGARLRGRENAPAGRRFGNDAADWFVSWTAGQAIVDTQSGQRYYPREVLELAKNLPHSGFVFESEILIEAAEHGIRCVSVAIESRYQDGRRASHFRPFTDVMRITRMISWRLFCGGFRIGNYLRARREPPIVIE